MNTHDNQLKTGHVCPNTGVWVCHLHVGFEVRLKEGDFFPICKHVSGHPATWWELNPSADKH